MKIEVGKEYKSNIGVYMGSGGAKIQEIWSILVQLPDGRFVGECKKRDSNIVRIFSEDGKDGSTANGRIRQLKPTTTTKTVCAVYLERPGHDCVLVYANNKESAQQYADLAKMLVSYKNVQVVETNVEVDE